MRDPSGPSDEVRRRFLISVGVGEFDDASIPSLPKARPDAERMWSLMQPLGYERVLEEASVAPGADQLKRAIGDWAETARLGPDDVVVVYFAGHGVVTDRGRHYLRCRDSKLDRPTYTSLASESLCEALLEEPLGHLLVILDVCYANAAAMDLVRLAADLAPVQRENMTRAVLSAAWSKQYAQEGAFLDALTRVFSRPSSVGGAFQRYLSIGEITRQVNARFEEIGLVQRALRSVVNEAGTDVFFPNTDYLPGLAAGEVDLEVLARLRREARGHFETRARGVDHAGDHGDYFTARAAALREIAAWLRNPRHDLKARVVTGNPGSGKSALLGRILLDHRTTRSTASGGEPVIPADVPVVALHARRTTLESLVATLGEAISRPGCDLDQILETLAARNDPLVVVFDALDEAGTAGSADRPEIAGSAAEVRRIAGRLLRPLSELSQVRLIVGTRRISIGGRQADLAVLGRAITVLDLDNPAYLNQGDLAEYAYELLLAEQDPVPCSPYRERSALARKVADAIAARAGTSFLVARMTVQALVRGQMLIDTSIADWQQSLPSDAGEAFNADLDRYGPDRPKIERLLRPLAYAQGPGLPWSTIWASLATALSGVTCTDDDIEWLHQHAGAYVVETTDETGASAYRLFHETLAEHLRRPGRDREIHTTITTALLGQISKAPNRTSAAERAWDTAHAYVRRHLAEHAVAAADETLDRLLEDPGFLAYAEPTSLFPALPAASTETGKATAALYRTSGHSHLDPASRRQVLAIDAARRRHPLASALNDTLAWRVRWATGSLIHPAQRLVLTGHTRAVRAMGCIAIDGRPHAITASGDHTVRVWDLVDGVLRASLTGSRGPVACTMIDGRPHAVTGSQGGQVQVWDLVDGALRTEPPLTGVKVGRAAACTMIEGRPHVVVGSGDSVSVWDLTSDTQPARLDGHPPGPYGGENGVCAVACTMIDGRPHAVTGSEDHAARVWDLTDGTLRTTLTGHRDWVGAVACTVIGGHPHAVTGSHDGSVRVWDLSEDRPSGAELTRGFIGFVESVACTVIDGRPHVITGTHQHEERGTYSKRLRNPGESDERSSVRVWDLTDGTLRKKLTGHTAKVRAAASTVIDGRPHVLTGDDDGLVRVWDLTDSTSTPEPTGHTGRVHSAAFTTIGSRPHVVTGSNDNSVRVWDLADGTLRDVLPGHRSLEGAVACTEIGGHPHVVSTGGSVSDGTESAHVLDLINGIRRELVGYRARRHLMACTEIDGRPHVITDSHNGEVQVWDLTDGTRRGELRGHNFLVSAIACAVIDGRPHAVTSSSNFDTAPSMLVWDLTNGSKRSVLPGNPDANMAVACMVIDGRPHAIATSRIRDASVRLWDLADGAPRGELRHESPVYAVAGTMIGDQPHAITYSEDRSVWLWDLAQRRPVTAITRTMAVTALATSGETVVLCVGSDIIVLEYVASNCLRSAH